MRTRCGLVPGAFAAGVVLAGGLMACAAPLRPDPATQECRELFVQTDARVARAGAEDQGARRIPGFDHLRVNRLLASFRDQARTPAQWADWVERLRRLDLEAREVELRNMGDSDAAAHLRELDTCGRRLAAQDAQDPARQADLRHYGGVADDYSLGARMLGLYPLAVPFLKLGIRGFQRAIERDYATPTDRLDSPGPVLSWQAPAASVPVAPAELAAWLAQGDALGIPRWDAAQWQRLLATHAPQFLVETAGEHDRPGALVSRAGVPALDTREAKVYGLGTFTRFRGRLLPQLVYVLWFAERPPARRLDPYSGWLDGVVWRVTLDADGQVLVYDTIHSCGCYHYVFPVADLKLRDQASLWRERVLLPQGRVAPGPVALRLQSGTHYVRRVLPVATSGYERQPYRLVEYRELQMLPDARGGTRSLFGSGGLVEGSQRLERFWLWVSGVISPGTMRQWGRHATAFVGTRHFDDPALFDTLFHTQQAQEEREGREEPQKARKY